ncbi:hypothetical protein [Pseudomonas fluorescens]|nr:hypothetical protein [Pseudomonas fluorescens]
MNMNMNIIALASLIEQWHVPPTQNGRSVRLQTIVSTTTTLRKPV